MIAGGPSPLSSQSKPPNASTSLPEKVTFHVILYTITNQARNQLGTPEEAKSFLRGAKFFKLCPIVSNYVRHIFPGGAKNFPRGFAPLVTSLLRTLPSAVDLLLSRPANKGENQPITNFKPQISTNTTVTSKNVKVCSRRSLFCSNLCDASGMI